MGVHFIAGRVREEGQCGRFCRPGFVYGVRGTFKEFPYLLIQVVSLQVAQDVVGASYLVEKQTRNVVVVADLGGSRTFAEYLYDLFGKP